MSKMEQTVYTCDTCGCNRVIDKNIYAGRVLTSSWVRLFTSSENPFMSQEKDFCCKECAAKFLQDENKVKGA